MMGDIAKVRPAVEGVSLASRGQPSARLEPARAAASPAGRTDGGQANEGAKSSKPRLRMADLDSVANKLNGAASALDVQAHFSVHKSTGRIMVKIINTRTGQVLREIPPEKLVDLASSMERMLGLVVDEKR